MKICRRIKVTGRKAKRLRQKHQGGKEALQSVHIVSANTIFFVGTSRYGFEKCLKMSLIYCTFSNCIRELNPVIRPALIMSSILIQQVSFAFTSRVYEEGLLKDGQDVSRDSFCTSVIKNHSESLWSVTSRTHFH